MTKLDENFVKEALEQYPAAAHYINALAEEVRRLETLGGRYEAALEEIGKLQNAPFMARNALRPIDPEAFKARLGPSVAEQLAASETATEDNNAG